MKNFIDKLEQLCQRLEIVIFTTIIFNLLFIAGLLYRATIFLLSGGWAIALFFITLGWLVYGFPFGNFFSLVVLLLVLGLNEVWYRYRLFHPLALIDWKDTPDERFDKSWH